MTDATGLIRASMQVHGTYGNERFESSPNWAHENPDLIEPERRAEINGVISTSHLKMDEALVIAQTFSKERSYLIPRTIRVAGEEAIPNGFDYRISKVATARFQTEWLLDTVATPDGSESITAMGGLIVASKGLCLRFHKNDLWEDAFDVD